MGHRFRRVPIVIAMIIAIILAVASFPTPIGSSGMIAAAAASDRPIYRYVDPNGTLVFTDDLSKIPPEHRSSAKIVELPPALKLPEPPPPPNSEGPSLLSRIRDRWNGWPVEYRLMVGGILPMMVLAVGTLYILRKRSESVGMRMLFRLAMLIIVVASTYSCYFLFMRAQAARWIGTIPAGSGLQATPQQILEPLQQQETDRLKHLKDIADQK